MPDRTPEQIIAIRDNAIRAALRQIAQGPMDSGVAEAKQTLMCDPEIKRILNSPTLTFEGRKREIGIRVRQLLNEDAIDQAGIEKIEMEMTAALEKGRQAVFNDPDINPFAHESIRIKNWEDLWTWQESTPILQKPSSSRVHDFIEANQKGRVVFGTQDENINRRTQQGTIAWARSSQVFIVQHDWAQAFKHASDFGGEDDYELPYGNCLFEFQISGRRMLVMVSDVEPGHYGFCVQERDLWIYYTSNKSSAGHVSQYAIAQIRALCIALDADVAETEIQRAPHKLNKAREKARRPLLKDYHLVSLARKHRTVRLESSGEPGTRKRLHFRRGHWRHYATFKTWIKWCLVGDPDLGFIDKDYLA